MKGKSDDLLRYILKFAGFAEEVWELFYVSPFLARNSTRNFRNTKDSVLVCGGRYAPTRPTDVLPKHRSNCHFYDVRPAIVIDGHVNAAVWMSCWQSLLSLERFPLVWASQ